MSLRLHDYNTWELFLNGGAGCMNRILPAG